MPTPRYEDLDLITLIAMNAADPRFELMQREETSRRSSYLHRNCPKFGVFGGGCVIVGFYCDGCAMADIS